VNTFGGGGGFGRRIGEGVDGGNEGGDGGSVSEGIGSGVGPRRGNCGGIRSSGVVTEIIWRRFFLSCGHCKGLASSP